MKPPRAFYDRPTLEVARDLLGLVLVHNRRGVRTTGIIVEVEAYIGESDPACHAAPGPTRRNAPLYGSPGHAYVYLNYGIHCLVNVVTEAHGSPAAVLIRALEPLEGLDGMRARRGLERPQDLCSGPGKLTQALGIWLDLNGTSLQDGPIELLPRPAGIEPPRLAVGERIGITHAVELPWRFCVVGNPNVSRPRPSVV